MKDIQTDTHQCALDEGDQKVALDDAINSLRESV